jgi:hypothetical protein
MTADKHRKFMCTKLMNRMNVGHRDSIDAIIDSSDPAISFAQ